ncbi:MAG: FG-GAP-like repeat-containing protein [Nitrospirota bacterium]|nr:FG-GAP-like repeat-containing protein [Nitrospirota bacterium]
MTRLSPLSGLGLACALLLSACADASPELPCGAQPPEMPPVPIVGDVTTVTSRAQMEISGQRDPWSAIHVDGLEQVPLGCDRYWSLTVALVDGVNTFQITAVGDLGNESAPVPVTIRRDNGAPLAPAISAASESVTLPGTTEITGTREDGARLLLNGLPLVPPGTGTAITASVPLSAVGANTLSFTQVDAAGNESPPTVIAVTRTSTPLAPPRMNYPLQDDRIGAAPPTTNSVGFVWIPEPTATAYRLEIAASPAFDPTLTTVLNIPSPATQTIPWSASPGIWYWRIASVDGTGAATFGQTRRFSVGNARNDVNGDGFSDLAVGAPGDDGGLSPLTEDNRGRVELFYGRADLGTVAPPDTESAAVIYQGTVTHGNFGLAVTMGDLNGDGFADLAVGSPFENADGRASGAARVFFGGSGLPGLIDTPDLTLPGQNDYDYTGTQVASGFDVNGDGFDDLVVTAYGYDAPGAADAGRVYLYFGGDPMDTVPDRIITGDRYIGYLGSGIAAADMNADGWPDLALGEPNAGVPDGMGGTLAEAGRVQVLFGGPQMDGVADLILPGVDAGEHLGESVARAGDMNGVGFDMLAAGAPKWGTGMAPHTGKVRLFAAGLIPALTTAQVMEIQGAVTNEGFGGHLSGGGDVNGDGYADLAVGVPYSDQGAADPSGTSTEGDQGMVEIHLGAATIDNLWDARVVGAGVSSFNDWLGYGVSMTGDMNGDTLTDVAFGAPGNDDTVSVPPVNNTGRAYMILGEGGGMPSWNTAGCLFPTHCGADIIGPAGSVPGAVFPGTTGRDWLGLAIW